MKRVGGAAFRRTASALIHINGTATTRGLHSSPSAPVVPPVGEQQQQLAAARATDSLASLDTLTKKSRNSGSTTGRTTGSRVRTYYRRHASGGQADSFRASNDEAWDGDDGDAELQVARRHDEGFSIDVLPGNEEIQDDAVRKAIDRIGSNMGSLSDLEAAAAVDVAAPSESHPATTTMRAGNGAGSLPVLPADNNPTTCDDGAALAEAATSRAVAASTAQPPPPHVWSSMLELALRLPSRDAGGRTVSSQEDVSSNGIAVAPERLVRLCEQLIPHLPVMAPADVALAVRTAKALQPAGRHRLHEKFLTEALWAVTQASIVAVDERTAVAPAVASVARTIFESNLKRDSYLVGVTLARIAALAPYMTAPALADALGALNAFDREAFAFSESERYAATASLMRPTARSTAELEAEDVARWASIVAHPNLIVAVADAVAAQAGRLILDVHPTRPDDKSIDDATASTANVLSPAALAAAVASTRPPIAAVASAADVAELLSLCSRWVYPSLPSHRRLWALLPVHLQAVMGVRRPPPQPDSPFSSPRAPSALVESEYNLIRSGTNRLGDGAGWLSAPAGEDANDNSTCRIHQMGSAPVPAIYHEPPPPVPFNRLAFPPETLVTLLLRLTAPVAHITDALGALDGDKHDAVALVGGTLDTVVAALTHGPGGSGVGQLVRAGNMKAILDCRRAFEQHPVLADRFPALWDKLRVAHVNRNQQRDKRGRDPHARAAAPLREQLRVMKPVKNALQRRRHEPIPTVPAAFRAPVVNKWATRGGKRRPFQDANRRINHRRTGKMRLMVKR